MKLHTIKIKNFRCFEDYQFPLGNETTVVIGKNGTGKTSLIRAMKNGLSFIFSKNPQYKQILSQSNGCNIKAFSLWDARYDDSVRGFYFPVQIDYKGSFLERPIKWTLYKPHSEGKLSQPKYRDALNTILTEYNANVADSKLPLLAYFSDTYPHIESNVGKNAAKIATMDILPRDFAYYAWDEETSCTEIWQQRYIKISNAIRDFEDDIKQSDFLTERILLLDAPINNADAIDRNFTSILESAKETSQEKLERINKAINSKKTVIDKFKEERDYIDNKMYIFSSSVREDIYSNSEFKINRIVVNRPDRKNYCIEFLFNDSKTMFFDTIPQGYNRLLSIVFDLAYRSYILNGKIESEGIILIDEIELHLHPTLQQEVLSRFKKTFPKLQFVVSTHSPLVISNFNADGEKNIILRLENKGNIYSNSAIENVYGLDYGTNLQEVMNVAPRSSTIDKYINGYLFLFGKKRESEANQLLDKLREYLGGSIPGLLQKEIDEQKKAYL